MHSNKKDSTWIQVTSCTIMYYGIKEQMLTWRQEKFTKLDEKLKPDEWDSTPKEPCNSSTSQFLQCLNIIIPKLFGSKSFQLEIFKIQLKIILCKKHIHKLLILTLDNWPAMVKHAPHSNSQNQKLPFPNHMP